MTTPANPSSDASSNPLVAALLKSIVPLYTTVDLTEQVALIDSIYIPNAVFDNNLFHVMGTDKIKGLFKHAVKNSKGAAKVTVQSSSIEPITDSLILAVSPAAQKVKLWLLQEYEHKKGPKTRTIETVLTVNSEGKVTDHVDAWQGEKTNFKLLKHALGGATAMLG